MATSQRDVRNRIGAVKNIQKITRAMEMVAAARLRRAEQRIEALRPYARAIRRMTRQAAEAAGSVPRLPILAEHDQVNNVGLLLVAGDRGLAGAFNSNIVRAATAAGRIHSGEGRSPIYFASGRRAASSRARERQQQTVEPLAVRAFAEHMQPIADLQVLQLAQEPVELLQRRSGVLARR